MVPGGVGCPALVTAPLLAVDFGWMPAQNSWTGGSGHERE